MLKLVGHCNTSLTMSLNLSVFWIFLKLFVGWERKTLWIPQCFKVNWACLKMRKWIGIIIPTKTSNSIPILSLQKKARYWEYTRILRFVRCKKLKIKKKNTQRQSHDTRNYVVRQFAYVHGVALISLFSRKLYKVW